MLFSTIKSSACTKIGGFEEFKKNLGQFEKKKNRPHENTPKKPFGHHENSCISVKNDLFNTILVHALDYMYINNFGKF